MFLGYIICYYFLKDHLSAFLLKPADLICSKTVSAELPLAVHKCWLVVEGLYPCNISVISGRALTCDSAHSWGLYSDAATP